MFSSPRLKLSIIICYEKKYFFKKKLKSIILFKEAFEKTIFKIIQVIFNQY